jgi:hypothetical protein
MGYMIKKSTMVGERVVKHVMLTDGHSQVLEVEQAEATVLVSQLRERNAKYEYEAVLVGKEEGER